MIIGDMGREEVGEKREMEGILITLQRVEMGVEGDRNLLLLVMTQLGNKSVSHPASQLASQAISQPTH